MITKDDFKALLKPVKNHVVSIYMPTHQAAVKEKNQDKIRLRNLTDEAENDLKALGYDRHKILKKLEAVRQLEKDEPFWQNQRQGLAVFISNQEIKDYRLLRTPPELVATSRYHHIKPLLPLLDIDRNFYILCVSLNRVRLFKADPENIDFIEADNLPEDINDALGYDDNERSIQHFVASTNSPRSDAVFHGHGAAKDLSDIDPPRFIRAVASAVERELNHSQTPLVFAGDDKLFSLFREFSRNANLLDDHLSGNHDDVRPDELHRKALDITMPHFKTSISEAVERYLRVKANSPELDGDEAVMVAEAALAGKVAELLIRDNKQKWADLSKDQTVSSVLPTREPGAVDLFDVAAAATLKHGGKVYMLEPDVMPNRQEVAAVLRY